MTSSAHDRSKLPKWAQEEMDRRDRTIEGLTAEIDLLRSIGESEDCSVYLVNYTDKGTELRPLGRYAKVLLKGASGDIEVDVTHDGRIHAWFNEGAINIRPVSSNVVELRGEVW